MPEGRGLFEVARERMRTRHLALRTEQAYLQWMRRYVKFHNRRHPRDMGPAEVEAFLTHLAADAKVGTSTQNQALQALLFLYRQVLGMELPRLDNVTRARRAKRLPVVLSAAEVRSVLSYISGTSWLIASLLYGSGLRLMEAHRLRVKDLLLERGEIIVRDAKGGKDRVTVLPQSLAAPLREYLAKLLDRFERQRKSREPGVWLPPRWRANTLSRQFSGAGNGSFLRTRCAGILTPADRSAITDTKKSCSARSSRPCTRRAYRSRRVAIPFVIALPPTCSKRAPIFAPCRNCSVTPMWQQPCFTLM
jgi:integrase